nr:immunoglobulin light chain junction region [Macaca mulatta]
DYYCAICHSSGPMFF